MTQAISALGLQLKPQATLQNKTSGAIAFAGSPKTPARNASNSNSVTMIALIGLGVAAAIALVAGAIAYFRKPASSEPATS